MMAEEKKKPTAKSSPGAKKKEPEKIADGNNGNIAETSAAVGNDNKAEVSLSEKLKAAAGNITRHNADSKARQTEREKLQKKAEEANQARAEEAEKQRLESEKQARLLKEQKLAAFEYAENYRKKLKKDKERAQTAAQIRAKEEREAALARAREEREKEIAAAIEQERADAQARADKANEILNIITKCAVTDENGNTVMVDRSELIAKARAEAEAAALEREKSAVETPIPAEPETVNEEPVPEPPKPLTEEERQALAEERTRDFLLKELIDENGNINLEDERYILEFENEAEPEPEEKSADDSAEREAIDAYNDALAAYQESLSQMQQPTVTPEPAPAPSAVKPKPAPAPKKKPKPASPPPPVKKPEPVKQKVQEDVPDLKKKRSVKDERWDPEEIQPVVIDDDIVRSIKEEGKNVTTEKELRKYLKRSRKVIKSFYDQVSRIEQNMDRDADDSHSPAMLVSIIQILGKILEIRCDNVSTCAIIGIEKYTAESAYYLAADIDEYNARVANFKILTGESLTRVSAFLPEHLMNGTGEAVIPVLSYRENYIEVAVDKDGNIIEDNDNVTTIVVAPPFTAEEALGDNLPDDKRSSSALSKKAQKANNKYDKAIEENEKKIKENSERLAKNLEREQSAVEDREIEIRELNARMLAESRDEKIYGKKLLNINNRYGKIILKARIERAKAEYEQNNLRLTVENFAIAREKTLLYAALLRRTRAYAGQKDLIATKTVLVDEMVEYNKRSNICSKAINKKLAVMSGALADEIGRYGTKYPVPKMACRRELIETVGENTRVVGDRLKPKPVDENARPDNSNIFDRDKSLEDRALAREQVMVTALRQKSETVEDKKSYRSYLRKAKRTVRRLKRTVRQTNRAIFRSPDEYGVYVGLVENMRVRGRLIEARTINMETAVKMGVKRDIKKEQDRLYDDIQRYNGRAIDYKNITGEKFTRISSFLPENMAKDISEAVIPALTYKETYIEAFPKTSDAAKGYAPPAVRRADDYTPLDCHNIKLTENPTVEVTAINPPVSVEETMELRPASTVWECNRANMKAFAVLYRLNWHLGIILRREKRNNRRSRRFDKKLLRINKRYDKKLFKLESSMPGSKRTKPEYQTKLSRLNGKYQRALIKLRYRRVARAIERWGMKLAVEEFVIRREMLEVQCARLFNIRNYGRPVAVSSAKRKLLDEIREYNMHAADFSKIIDAPITRVSPVIVDELARNAKKIYNFPKIICCREIIESVGEKSRAIGDRYRFGLPFTVNSQGVAVMTGTSLRMDDIGSPNIGLDYDGNPILGATGTGLRYVGPPDDGTAGIAIPNPLSKKDPRRPTFIRNGDAEDLDSEEEITSLTETPLSSEVEKLREYLGEAVKARSRAVSSPLELFAHLWRARRVERKLYNITVNNTIKRNKQTNRLRKINDSIDEILNSNVRKRNLGDIGKNFEMDFDTGDTIETFVMRDKRNADLFIAEFSEERKFARSRSEELQFRRFELRHNFESFKKKIRDRIDNLPVNQGVIDNAYIDLVLDKKYGIVDIKALLLECGITNENKYLCCNLERANLEMRIEILDEIFIDKKKDVASELENTREQIRNYKHLRASLARSGIDYKEKVKELSSVLEPLEAEYECLTKNRKRYQKRRDALEKQLKRFLSRSGRYHKCKVELHKQHRRIRQDLFRLSNEGHALVKNNAILDMKALAAQGRYVEIKCVNLHAASKIEISRLKRPWFWMFGFGMNPKNKARNRLYNAIKSYNDRFFRFDDAKKYPYIEGRKLVENLTYVSALLPDRIADRTGMEIIPNLIYREKFVEVHPEIQRRSDIDVGLYWAHTPNPEDETVDKFDFSKALLVPIKARAIKLRNKNSKKGISPVVETSSRYDEEEKSKKRREIKEENVLTSGDYRRFIREYKHLSKTVDRRVAQTNRDVEAVRDRIDKIRIRKIWATRANERAVFRIGRRTYGTVEYQRKMRRRLAWFRWWLYHFERREQRGNVLKRLSKGQNDMFTGRGLIIGLEGWVRRGTVQTLVLERQRIVFALRMINKIRQSQWKRTCLFGRNRASFLAKAEKLAVDAMRSYNKCADNGLRIIRETNMARIDDRKILREVMRGNLEAAIALVPKIACVEQIVEQVTGEDENFVNLSIFGTVAEEAIPEKAYTSVDTSPLESQISKLTTQIDHLNARINAIEVFNTASKNPSSVPVSAQEPTAPAAPQQD